MKVDYGVIICDEVVLGLGLESHTLTGLEC